MRRPPRVVPRRSVALHASGLVLAVACGPVQEPPSAAAPENVCTATADCKYVQANNVRCVAGACVVPRAGGPSTSDLVAVIQVPTDAFPACTMQFDPFHPPTCSVIPGRPLPIAYDTLVASAKTTPTGIAAVLPVPTVASGFYELLPATAGTDFGNQSLITCLPIHATFRPLWRRSDGTLVDAATLGLPLEPIEANIQLVAYGRPGPQMGPSSEFVTYLPPGTYERTLTPDAPYGETFGPIIEDVDASFPSSPNQLVSGFDATGGNAVPAFAISRQDGPLDGWVTYLRDLTTGRPVSNVAPLGGSTTNDVVFTVKRIPLDEQGADPDALANDELIVEPPAGSPLPRGVFNLFGMISPISYPALPPPAVVSGAVQSPGRRAPVQLVFEALSITGGVNFEYTTSTIATPDPATGRAPYRVVVPQGTYRVSIVPQSPDAAEQVSSLPVAGDQTADFALAAPTVESGVVEIADTRPLAGAEVDAIPLSCGGNLGSSPWCLPRARTATTAVDGTFTIALDPGRYLLRVRPRLGARLPWFVSPAPLTVGAAARGALSAPLYVPAPMDVGLRIMDAAGNPLPNAVVRMFRMPMPSATVQTAIEIGEATTDEDGRYEMLVAPPPSQ